MPIQLGNLRLYTLQELSKKFSLTLITLRNYIKQGKLKARKVGVRWYVTEKTLEEYFNAPERKRGESGALKRKPHHKGEASGGEDPFDPFKDIPRAEELFKDLPEAGELTKDLHTTDDLLRDATPRR